MARSLSWRRIQQRFGVGAPQVDVRTRLPWWGRAGIALALVAIVAGMWWWGFDFGQLFDGVNRKEIEAKASSLDAENARLRAEAGELRARNSALESALAMSRGAEQALTRQAGDLTGENAQLKEEVAFLQQLVADVGAKAGLSIPRLSVERESDGAYRYRLLVVRGGDARDEFGGHVTLQATVVPGPAAEQAAPLTLRLPDDQPDAQALLALRFKYYQRVEGTIRVPTGARLTVLTARAYEDGNASPRVTRTLTIS